MNECKIENCERQVHVAKRGLCQSHYQVWARNNRPRGTAQECSVEECNDTSYARTFCRSHYGKWMRHGQPTAPVKPTVFCKYHPDRKAAVKSIELCGSCYQRQWNGLEGPAKTYRQSSYWAAHHRQYRAKGQAADYRCVWQDCPDAAMDWALQHDHPSVVVDEQLKNLLYSMDVDAYQPMCRKHHRQYDTAFRKSAVAA